MTTRDDVPQDLEREAAIHARLEEEQRLQALRDNLHQEGLQALSQHFKKWLYTLDKRALWKIREDGFITAKFAPGPGRKPDISPGKLLDLRDEYQHLKNAMDDYVKNYRRGALRWDRNCKERKDFVEKIAKVVQRLHELGKWFWRPLERYDEDAMDPNAPPEKHNTWGDGKRSLGPWSPGQQLPPGMVTGKWYLRRKPLEQEIALKIAQSAVGRGKRPRSANKDAIVQGLLAHYHNTRLGTIRGRLQRIKSLRRGFYPIDLYE